MWNTNTQTIVEKSGSVRVDLLGGTIDLDPIHLILQNVCTLNLATSLKVKVKVSPHQGEGIVIKSHDYQAQLEISAREWSQENIYQYKKFNEYQFVVQIIDYFFRPSLHPPQGLMVEISSQIPPGTGLGGSSAMGVTLFKALADYMGKKFSATETVTIVKAIEARILECGPTGYQDYYPALCGGILALLPKVGGVDIEQLYSADLVSFLEQHLTLVYSGQSRLSGLNNWDVYKAFFDKRDNKREKLQEIATLSHRALLAIKETKFNILLDCIAQEGQVRSTLAPGILTPLQQKVVSDLLAKRPQGLGVKACGAGGGGCFLITHAQNDKQMVAQVVQSHGMQVLPFHIDQPCQQD